jgi:anion-transporting  ArsA/GET3 family ATPase
MNDSLDLTRYRLVICLGPGGVGKTTFSAGLALHAAALGRQVHVMTIDPAPRLLDALCLTAEDAESRVVDLHGLPVVAGGELRASRLDPKRTFDELVTRHAPSAAARDAILSGRIYQNLSTALAGVADYMAIERVLAESQDSHTDLIVLDTPPAHEAFDFLDAPRRITELMRSRAVTLLSASRSLIRTRFNMLDLAARAVLSAFDRLTGLRLLTDVQAFVAAFDGMYEGFADRADAAATLLRAPSTLIILVTTAEIERVEQVREFSDALRDRGLRLGAVAINRLTAHLPEPDAIRSARWSAQLKRKVQRNYDDYAALKDRESAAIEPLRTAIPAGVPLIRATELPHEPRTLKELAAFAASFEAEKDT